MISAAPAGAVISNLKPPPPSAPQPITRFAVTMPPGQVLQPDRVGSSLAFSPNGKHLVYLASVRGGARQIYVRPVDGLEAKVLPGTDGASEVFFSADGQWVGFFNAVRTMTEVSLGQWVSLRLAAPVA